MKEAKPVKEMMDVPAGQEVKQVQLVQGLWMCMKWNMMMKAEEMHMVEDDNGGGGGESSPEVQ